MMMNRRTPRSPATAGRPSLAPRSGGATVSTLLFLVSALLNLGVFVFVLDLRGLRSGAGSPESEGAPRQSGFANANATHDNNGDYALAHRQSFGFFDDVPAAAWTRQRDIYLRHSDHRDPARPLMWSAHDPVWNGPEGGSARAWYQNHYEPNFGCMHEMRLGGETMNGDGPKWVCDPHRIRRLARERTARDPRHPGCVVYSIGCNGDFNFELGVQKEIGEGICEFHIFDMGDYAEKVPKGLQRAHYHRWGLKKQGSGKASPSPGETYYGLQDIVKLLKHESLEVIDIFKIDCEGCEWETYSDWTAKGIPRLQQILVEVHQSPPLAPEFFDALEASGGYLRFHKEPNIQYDPGCVEYAFIKVSKEFMKGKKNRILGGETHGSELGPQKRPSLAAKKFGRPSFAARLGDRFKSLFFSNEQPSPPGTKPLAKKGDGTIPKILVQSYFDVRKVPGKVYRNIEEFAPGWTHLIYDDANATAFLQKHFRPEVARRFGDLRGGAFKADLFRCAFLYIHGGFWLDVDTELRVPLHDVFDRRNTTLYSAVAWNHPDLIFNAVLAAAPGNELLLELLDKIVDSGWNGSDYDFSFVRWFGEIVMQRTGQEELTAGLKLVVSPKGDSVFLWTESCSEKTSDICPRLDRYGLCCFVYNGDEEGQILFKSRYDDYPWK